MRYFSVEPIPGTNASMQVYLHDATDRFTSRPCILIFPGGGYRFVSEREAEPIALPFLQAGFQACILHYSTRPTDDMPLLGDTPMQEGAAALGYIRAHVGEWEIDPHKVTVCGFSAGGHAAGSTGVFWNTHHIPASTADTRPDAMLLCYPVISAGIFAHSDSFFNLTGNATPSPQTDAYSLEKHVTPHTPPTFLWHTFEDAVVPIQNTLLMANALYSAGVPVELHAYTKGSHGLSLATAETGPTDTQAATWLPLALSWLSNMGLGLQ